MSEPAGRRLLLLVGHSTGGIGGHVASLARGLPGHGWQPLVVTAARTADRFDLGPRVERLWPPRAPMAASRALLRLRRLVSDSDVVHAHGHQAGLLALAVRASLPPARRPVVVVSWHNAVLAGGAGRRLLALGERAQARGADLLTGASADLVERARGLGAGTARLAPVPAPAAGGGGGRGAAGQGGDPGGSSDPGEDPSRGDAARRRLAAELGVDPAARWVLTVSRIAPQKDLGTLVAAAGVLAARPGPQPVWLVVGDGAAALAQRLRERALATGAPVRLVGARRDVPALMSLAEVFVLTSRWEARALVVQEAMAAGTPVVCTRVGGLPELLDGAGLLVPPGDAAALADAVGRVLAEPDLAARLAAAGRRRFAELPDEAAVLADWDATYRRLLRA